MYTNASFAALMTFLKQRIVMKWGEIFDEPIQDQWVEASGRMPQLRDTGLQLYLFGVKDLPPIIAKQDALPVGAQRGSGGVLTLDTRPAVFCVVVTIPRERLVPHSPSGPAVLFSVRVVHQ